MFLLVDAGNSSIKWNVYDAAHKQFQWPPQSFLWRTDDLPGVLNKQWSGLKNIDAALIANVAGEKVQHTIQEWLQTHWGIQARLICTEPQAFGVRNGYQTHSQLGVDRWLAVLAASQLAVNQNVCVVQCGTAITVDTLTAQGYHKGGLIIPGPQTMKKALLQQTHGVKISENNMGVSPFTDSTSAAVNHGVLMAAVGFIDRAVDAIETELGSEVVKIISGGDAPIVCEHSRHTFMHEPELVLKGLALYANENT